MTNTDIDLTDITIDLTINDVGEHGVLHGEGTSVQMVMQGIQNVKEGISDTAYGDFWVTLDEKAYNVRIPLEMLNPVLIERIEQECDRIIRTIEERNQD